MTDLPLTGGCNCGAVRFEVTEPLGTRQSPQDQGTKALLAPQIPA
jgi:hypothetical protein